jgi:predicted metal-dependent hydrolase
MRWIRNRKIRRRKRRASSVTKHYLEHKEEARRLIHARLEYFNTYYQLGYKRVAVRNQRRCWGSCSALGNLNFSYRLLFLPSELSDYIIAHELCHLKELNHSPRFWDLLSKTIPDFKRRKQTLKKYDRLSATVMEVE